ncbi:WXG100 family type VII secretion target [Amycolatopsis australiensis]|uniref:Proteins of 100 residues with WXG n=1 Tax=Amycolatopsis australiensis TaxID=546364 RepID=A0A1K1SKI4_9PSEU|nr:WXG100 family type VII secretion target [Amycolatopsis australiensis]SFW84700.1 Proteins of 100 residues with WXG [Amycolatopsis australiensis]
MADRKTWSDVKAVLDDPSVPAAQKTALISSWLRENPPPPPFLADQEPDDIKQKRQEAAKYAGAYDANPFFAGQSVDEAYDKAKQSGDRNSYNQDQEKKAVDEGKAKLDGTQPPASGDDGSSTGTKTSDEIFDAAAPALKLFETFGSLLAKIPDDCRGNTRPIDLDKDIRAPFDEQRGISFADFVADAAHFKRGADTVDRTLQDTGAQLSSLYRTWSGAGADAASDTYNDKIQPKAAKLAQTLGNASEATLHTATTVFQLCKGKADAVVGMYTDLVGKADYTMAQKVVAVANGEHGNEEDLAQIAGWMDLNFGTNLVQTLNDRGCCDGDEIKQHGQDLAKQWIQNQFNPDMWDRLYQGFAKTCKDTKDLVDQAYDALDKVMGAVKNEFERVSLPGGSGAGGSGAGGPGAAGGSGGGAGSGAGVPDGSGTGVPGGGSGGSGAGVPGGSGGSGAGLPDGSGVGVPAGSGGSGAGVPGGSGGSGADVPGGSGAGMPGGSGLPGGSGAGGPSGSGAGVSGGSGSGVLGGFGAADGPGGSGPDIPGGGAGSGGGSVPPIPDGGSGSGVPGGGVDVPSGASGGPGSGGGGGGPLPSIPDLSTPSGGSGSGSGSGGGGSIPPIPDLSTPSGESGEATTPSSVPPPDGQAAAEAARKRAADALSQFSGPGIQTESGSGPAGDDGTAADTPKEFGGDPIKTDPTGDGGKLGDGEPDVLKVKQGDKTFEMTEPDHDGKMDIKVGDGPGDPKDFKLDWSTESPQGTDDGTYHPGADGKIHIEDGDVKITAERPDGPDGPTVVTVDDGKGTPTTYTLGEEDKPSDTPGADLPSHRGTLDDPGTHHAGDTSHGDGSHSGGEGSHSGGHSQSSGSHGGSDSGSDNSHSSGSHAGENSHDGSGSPSSDTSRSSESHGGGSHSGGTSHTGGADNPAPHHGGGGPSAAGFAGGSHGGFPAHSFDGGGLGETPTSGGAHTGTAQPQPVAAFAPAAAVGGAAGQPMSGMPGGMGAMGGGGHGGGGGDTERRSPAYRIEGAVFDNLGEPGRRIIGSLNDDDDPPSARTW